MPKRNAALDAIQGRGQPADPAPNVVPMTAEVPAVSAKAADKSDDQARVMLYLHPKVARKFKEMAFVEDRKANDIYLEALDLYLTQQGHNGLKGVIER